MSRRITILKVDNEKSPKGYPVTSISYTGDDGKVKGMKVMPFGDQKAIADAFKTAVKGDVFEVEFGKNDRDFWEFKSAHKVGGNAEVGSTSAKKDTWVPDNERQTMIVRQSSIASAVQLLQGTKEANPAKVLEVAKQFEAYVLSKTSSTGVSSKPQTGDVE